MSTAVYVTPVSHRRTNDTTMMTATTPTATTKSYDIDQSNTIETDEFIDFMTQEFLAFASPPPGQIFEASSEQLWEIPR